MDQGQFWPRPFASLHFVTGVLAVHCPQLCGLGWSGQQAEEKGRDSSGLSTQGSVSH